jgi:DNA-binding NtrC family response regulator
VLVIDDESLLRWCIAETLRADGYVVVEACNAASALAEVRDAERAPDAVLLDLRLPDCDDLRLLEALQQIVPLTPVIVMTAFGTPEIVREAKRLGAHAVLRKPFDLADLAPVLASAIK